MKRMLKRCVVAAAGILLSATCLADVQLVYRGRIAQKTGGFVTEALTVSFNLYELESGGESLWGLQKTVTPDRGGSIEVLLADGLADVTYLVPGATLANAVRTGRARYVGVTVQGGRELLPRQMVCAQPYAREARQVSCVAARSMLGRLTAEQVTTKDLKIGQHGSLLVSQKLELSETNAVPAKLNLEVADPASLPVRVRGGEAKPLWGDWQKCAPSCLVNGTFTPPVDGVYLLTTLRQTDLGGTAGLDSALTGWWAPGLVFFGRKGKPIELPYVGELATKQQPTVYYRPFNVVDGN